MFGSYVFFINAQLPFPVLRPTLTNSELRHMAKSAHSVGHMLKLPSLRMAHLIIFHGIAPSEKMWRLKRLNVSSLGRAIS